MMRAALSIWILSAAVCLARGDHDHLHENNHDHEPHTEAANTAINLQLVSSANKEFAVRLYKMLAAQTDFQGKNIFFSPTSVTLALAALSAGARGETYRQLFNTLGYASLTQADTDRAFQTILTRFNSSTQEDLRAGTAVFVKETFKPKPGFLEILKHSYLSDAFTVDFANTTASKNTINSYVKEKTNGKIANLIQHLDPATLMFLLSYTFFKGKWEFPFDLKKTHEDLFNVDEQTKVSVQMMNLEERFQRYYDQNISASVLQLPYKDSKSMLLVLPDTGLAEVEKAITQNHITKWLKWMKPRKTDLYLPKFSIKMSFSLKDVLSGMGIQSIFSQQADFSGISEERGLAVSEVVHQATLDVDEAGTVAAAGTGIVMTPTSLERVAVMKFDRPFMVILTESNSGDILFMGKIVNPNIDD